MWKFFETLKREWLMCVLFAGGEMGRVLGYLEWREDDLGYGVLKMELVMW